MAAKHTLTRTVVLTSTVPGRDTVIEVDAYLLTGDNNPRVCIDVKDVITLKTVGFRHGRFSETSRAQAEKAAVKAALESITDAEIRELYKEKLSEAVENNEEAVNDLENRLVEVKNDLRRVRELQFSAFGLAR